MDKKKTPKKVKDSISKQNKLTSIRWKDSKRLVLKFSRPIKKSELNKFFNLNQSNTKVVKINIILG